MILTLLTLDPKTAAHDLGYAIGYGIGTAIMLGLTSAFVLLVGAALVLLIVLCIKGIRAAVR